MAIRPCESQLHRFFEGGNHYLVVTMIILNCQTKQAFRAVCSAEGLGCSEWDSCLVTRWAFFLYHDLKSRDVLQLGEVVTKDRFVTENGFFCLNSPDDWG